MSELIKSLQSVEHADVPQKYLMIEAAQEIERLSAEGALKDAVIEAARTVSSVLDDGAEPNITEIDALAFALSAVSGTQE